MDKFKYSIILEQFNKAIKKKKKTAIARNLYHDFEDDCIEFHRYTRQPILKQNVSATAVFIYLKLFNIMHDFIPTYLNAIIYSIKESDELSSLHHTQFKNI